MARFSVVIFFALFLGGACASPNSIQQEGETPTPNEDRREALRGEANETPQGYSRVEVLGVLATPEGATVVILGSPETEQVLPIYIDPMQAMTIDLRQRGQRFQRPLTHDLLEDVMDQLGGELAKIHVHSLQESTYHAKLFILAGDRLLEIDARPSDAIALAVGKRVPIFVDQEVLDAGGFTEEELLESPPPSGPDPDQPTTI